jgi:hypothetical protein
MSFRHEKFLILAYKFLNRVVIYLLFSSWMLSGYTSGCLTALEDLFPESLNALLRYSQVSDGRQYCRNEKEETLAFRG